MSIEIDFNYAIDGSFESVNYYRSETTMNLSAMPAPTATGITGLTYSDTTVEAEKTYYVRFGSVKGSTEKISDEIIVNTRKDEYWSNVVVRLTFNTDFTDSTGRIWIMHNEPLIDENGKFGSCLDSRNGYLSCASSIGLYLDADFTIEFWMYALDTSNSADNVILTSNKTDSWSNGIAAINYLKDAKKVVLYNHTAGRLEVNNVETNEWTHICYSKIGGILRTFKNGILQNSYSDSHIYPFDTNGTYLCRDAWGAVNGTFQYDFKGYIDDLRITKGVGRYAASFTPPTMQLPDK